MKETPSYLARFERKATVFDGLAGDYDRFRPDYPVPILAAWRAHLDKGRSDRPRLVVDLGCGTGISTRSLLKVLDAADRVVGVEPGPDMRAAFPVHSGTAGIPLVAAVAERLPFDAGTVDALVAARAAHWMDRAALIAEPRRVLTPGGTLAFLNNDHYWHGCRFLEGYEALLERLSPGYDRRYRTFDYEAEFTVAGVADVRRVVHCWTRPLDFDGFFGLVRSSSMYKNAVAAHGAAEIESAVRDLATEHADERGNLSIPYRTELVAGRPCRA